VAMMKGYSPYAALSLPRSSVLLIINLGVLIAECSCQTSAPTNFFCVLGPQRF